MRKGHLHKYSRRRMISKFTNSLDKAHNYLRIRVVRVELGQSRNEHRKDKLALVQESVIRGTTIWLRCRYILIAHPRMALDLSQCESLLRIADKNS